MNLVVIVYCTFLNTLYMYHCLGGDRGWTPLVIKLAGVSKVKVLKFYIFMGVGSLGRGSVKW